MQKAIAPYVNCLVLRLLVMEEYLVSTPKSHFKQIKSLSLTSTEDYTHVDKPSDVPNTSGVL